VAIAGRDTRQVEIEDYLSDAAAKETLDTVVDWSRYAEILLVAIRPRCSAWRIPRAEPVYAKGRCGGYTLRNAFMRMSIILAQGG
jgi:hypothetical protein